MNVGRSGLQSLALVIQLNRCGSPSVFMLYNMFFGIGKTEENSRETRRTSLFMALRGERITSILRNYIRCVRILSRPFTRKGQDLIRLNEHAQSSKILFQRQVCLEVKTCKCDHTRHCDGIKLHPCDHLCRSNSYLLTDGLRSQSRSIKTDTYRRAPNRSLPFLQGKLNVHLPHTA